MNIFKSNNRAVHGARISVGAIFAIMLIMFFMPSFAWAQSSSSWSMPGPDDKSVIFLGYIFGVVNGLLHGTGSQIMGQMFAKFNSGILVLAGVVVFYTTILGLLNSAQDGEFLGKKLNSFFVPMRVALGIILITPTSTGYSWIQVLVMWIVLQGVGAANMVWHSALNYLFNQGGAVITQNQNDQGGVALVVRQSTQNLMYSVTCLELMQHAIDQVTYSHNASISVPSTSALETVTSSVTAAASLPPAQVIQGHPVSIVQMPNYTSASDNDWKQLNGICGTLTFEQTQPIAVNQVITDLASATPNISDTCGAGCYPSAKKPQVPGVIPPDPSYCKDGTFLFNGAARCNSAFNASCTVFGLPGDGSIVPTPDSPVLSGLLKDAQGGNANPVFSWCNGVDWSVPNISQTFNTAVMDFLGLTYSSVYKPVSSMVALWSALQSQGTSWFSAGAFYFALDAQNENAQYSTVHSYLVTTFPNNAQSLIIDNLNLTGNLASSQSVFEMWLEPFFTARSNNTLVKRFGVTVSPPTGGAVAQGQISPQAYGYDSGDWIDNPYNPSVGNETGDKILAIIAPGAIEMWYNFHMMKSEAQQENLNPVLLMMNFGAGMISTAIEMWFMIAVAGFAVGMTVASIPLLTLSVPITSFVQMLSGFVTALLLPMLVAGCMLLFYLPAVPFMIFTFGTIGWMVGVVEAMVAAPVVGFAIMSPEGHDIFGKGDPAVLLMLNVFLRPPLMIFGLIVGIMISYIGIWLINDGFGSIEPTIGMISNVAYTSTIGLVITPLIYMVMALQVINRSFTLIYVLPDKITRWIAGGQTEQLGSEFSNIEKDVKSGVQSGVQSIGQATKASWDGAAKAVDDGLKKAKDRKNDNNSDTVETV